LRSRRLRPRAEDHRDQGRYRDAGVAEQLGQRDGKQADGQGKKRQHASDGQ
jgi:hypothetical protein